MNLWLIGYMGSGKSTLANEFAKVSDFNLIDTDDRIESMVDMSLTTLWTKHGEAYFRCLERQVSVQCAREQKAIIATGGGLPIHSFGLDEMKENGIVIYLKSKASELWGRVSKSVGTRPLAIDRGSFEARLFKREPIYQQADVVLDATTSIVELMTELQDIARSRM